MSCERLFRALEESEIQYEVLHHKRDFIAQETAHDTHTPGAAFAKSVVLTTGERSALAVIPAPEHVDLDKAADALGATEAVLADEERMAELFPDCEVGAEPALGNLYGLPVLVDPALSENEFITFNAGTHEEAIRIRYDDYKRMARPMLAHITEEFI
ncbi:MAG: YbaK/EbsC family protein [Planctomycetota bacterium]|nr:YbaK/EbsC family protein [Planctomycetota bacterium]